MQQTFVQPTRGEDLRQERIRAGLKVFEVAARMHVHSSRVSQIEALARVTDATAARYRSALADARAAGG